MSNRVNPPKQVVLPPEVSSNPQLKKAFDDAYFILFQLWKRTGGGTDYVEDNQDGIQENKEGLREFDDIYGLVQYLRPNKPDIKITSTNYTSIGDQTIICNAAVTITLNGEPKDRELVKVIISNGDVTVNGNGKLLNKYTDQTVIFDNLITTATLDIVYILETDEWFII